MKNYKVLILWIYLIFSTFQTKLVYIFQVRIGFKYCVTLICQYGIVFKTLHVIFLLKSILVCFIILFVFISLINMHKN